MSKKRRLQLQRNKIVKVIPPKEETATPYFFSVFVGDDEITSVQQTDDAPADSTNANTSILSFTGWGLALITTWYPAKPKEGSDLRYEGYAEIFAELVNRNPNLKGVFDSVGFAHAKGAMAVFTTSD